MKEKFFQFFLLNPSSLYPTLALNDGPSLGGSILIWLHATALISSFTTGSPHNRNTPQRLQDEIPNPSPGSSKAFHRSCAACCSGLTSCHCPPHRTNTPILFLYFIHTNLCHWMLPEWACILRLSASAHVVPSAWGAFPHCSASQI